MSNPIDTALPFGWTRSGAVLEPLEGNPADLVWIVAHHHDHVARQAAAAKLGRAGYFAPIGWVSPAAVTHPAPAAPEPPAPCRRRHHRGADGLCAKCGAKRQRAPRNNVTGLGAVAAPTPVVREECQAPSSDSGSGAPESSPHPDRRAGLCGEGAPVNAPGEPPTPTPMPTDPLAPPGPPAPLSHTAAAATATGPASPSSGPMAGSLPAAEVGEAPSPLPMGSLDAVPSPPVDAPATTEPPTCHRVEGRAHQFPAPSPATAPPAGDSRDDGAGDVADDLAMAFDALDGAAGPLVPHAEFVPDTRAKVDWLARLLLELQERRERIVQAANARAAQFDAEIHSLCYRYGNALEAWLRAELVAQQKGRRPLRSVHLDEGRLGLRKAGGGIEIDRPTATQWAEKNDDPTAPAFGQWRYVLDTKALKAHVEATGEDLPGVTRVPERDVLYLQSSLRDAQGRHVMPQITLSLGARALEASPEEE